MLRTITFCHILLKRRNRDLTGKKFSINMCTVGHWKDGVMIGEWLFRDNATYMKQSGLGN